MTQQSAARAAKADEVIKSSVALYLQTQDAQTGDTMRRGLTELTQVLSMSLLTELYLAA